MVSLLCAAEVALQVAAGAQAERHASVVARSEGEDVTFSLGVESTASAHAPLRQSLSAAVEASGLLLQLEGTPPAAGFARVAGRAGARFGEVSLLALGRYSTHTLGLVRGAGARLELEHEASETTHFGGGVEAWALLLSTPRAASWREWSLATLDWPQRAAADAWLAHDFGVFTLTPGASVALPPDGVEVRGSLAAEVPVGVAKLKAELAVARLPELWLFDVALGVSFALH